MLGVYNFRCWSYVGKIGGRQDLSLEVGCGSLPTAAHELMHAMGVYHTQSPTDRNNYVDIYWDKIQESTYLHWLAVVN